MAVIKKTLFPKNLDNYSVLVNDIDVDSKYFKITSLPDTLTGGKNAFLIAGSEYLVADTKIQIELKDASGNIIYHEPGEGYISSSLNGVPFVTEYYEGISKVVSVYVYPDTAYGPCTLTILGELNSYNSDGDITSIVPLDWENKYNVKWQRQINVDPSLANTTKIRFYQRPQATITEILNPIYRIESGLKVESGISQSFADIRISNLETFAGDVKRVKVFRTSEGDISDYDLIQDILVESKELLTSYGLSGSVVGETGIFTAETLKNYWNTGSLNAYLTSSRVESGVRLTGSGYFTYTSSLDIKSANTYELNLDAFYSASISSNLGIYLVSGSTSSSIATLVGIQPTKHLLDTIIPFKIDKDYLTASLYFSQSQGEWHLGNISLKLSQDTAFSPDEIGFVTTMPTVIGNETYNFKFEFYDVNNNYVPVAVTQSATFTGGTNTGNTVLLISSSTSQSLAALLAVSSSISGTVTSNSSSTNIKINNVSSSISGSIYTLSGSIANELILTSGSLILLSSSFLQFTQSITSSLNSLSQSVSSSFYNVSGAINNATASLSASLSASVAFTIYSASQYLDKFIFTDETGKINQTPTASSPGLYLGSDHLGYYSGSSWKTYMDNQGDFYLTGSSNNFLAWSSQLGTLQVQGVINIQGGNAATTSSLNSATSSLLSSINNATASLSSSLAPNIFTDSTGKINRPPTTVVNSSEGLFLGSTHLGYYSGSNFKTYMANNGNFYLSGVGSNSLTWEGGVLSINGAITVTGGNAATDVNALLYATRAATSASLSGSSALTAASNAATSASLSGSSALTAASNAATSASLSGSSALTAASNAATSASLSGSAATAYALSQSTYTYNQSTALLQTLADGGYSGSFIGSTTIYSPNIGGQNGFISNILKVGQNGITLDGGNKAIYVGTGTYNNVNTPFYFASGSTNIFSLGNKLSWNGTTLSVIGDITVGSTLLTEAAILNTSTTAANVGLGNVSNLTPQNQAQTGLISGTTITGGGITLSGGGNIKGGQTAFNTGTGFFLGYSGTEYKFSIGNASTKGITWDGSTLSIGGDVNIGSSLASTVVSSITNINSTTSSLNSSVTNINSTTSSLNSSVTNINSTTSSINSSISQIHQATGSIVPASQILNHIGGTSITTITGGKVTTGQIKSGNHTGTADGSAFSTAGMSIDLDGGGISAKSFRITGAGAAFFSGSGTFGGDISAATGTFTGGVSGTGYTLNNSGLSLTNTASSITLGNGVTLNSNGLSGTGFSLNTSGVSATAGSIGGWDISNNAISKSVGGVGRMVLKSSDNTISMFDTSENLRLQLNPSTTLPTFASPTTTTTIDALDGVSTGAGTFPNAYIDTTTGNNVSITRTSNTISVVLTGTLNEIFIDDLGDRWYDPSATPEDNMEYFFYNAGNSNVIFGKYTMSVVVTGASGTFSTILGYAAGNYAVVNGAWENSSVFTNPAVFSNLAAGTYSVSIVHEFLALKVLTNTIRFYPWSNAYLTRTNTSSDITITYGTSTAYSVLNAGGVVFYNGSRNIFKLSQPATTADSFFQVTGKSQFNTSLYVSGALAADSKQFQITHPLNEDKWLYHSAIEGPGAYLIYKGTLELQNGVASASIDLLSKMAGGTFESLVRRTQFFVQNNSSWDLVRGRLGGGVVYIESNNTNSTASVDWMVVGERKDEAILNSVLYDNDGNYKPEKYKSSAFLRHANLEIESGSI